MKLPAAALGSSMFFALARGVVAGVVPWSVTGWDGSPASPALGWVGAALVVACGAVLVSAFWRFVREGLGTPAPIAPTSHLVVGGLYRHVRNPMYVAVVGAVAGQALLFGSAALCVYAGVLLAAFVAFVRGYEEPTLTRRYGPEYEAYRRAVPGWWPRVRPARLPRGMS